MPPKKVLQLNKCKEKDEDSTFPNNSENKSASVSLKNLDSSNLDLSAKNDAERKRLHERKRLSEQRYLRESIHSFEEEKINRECTDRATFLKELKDELKGLRERLVRSLFHSCFYNILWL